MTQKFHTVNGVIFCISSYQEARGKTERVKTQTQKRQARLVHKKRMGHGGPGQPLLSLFPNKAFTALQYYGTPGSSGIVQHSQ